MTVDTYTRVRASLCPFSALTELELDQHACRITEDVALAKLSPRHPTRFHTEPHRGDSKEVGA